MDIIPRIMTSASADHPFLSHPVYIVYLPMLKQINRWIDPLAEHLIISVKGIALARDHSAWVIRTIRSNSEAFSDPQAAARAVCIPFHPYISRSHI